MENTNLTNLLLIDNRVNDIQFIINSIELSKTKYVIVDFELDTLESIKQNINNLGLTNISNVGIFQENYYNSSYQFVKSFGNSVLVDVTTVDPELSSWSQYISLLQHLKTLGMSNLDLMGCSIGSDSNWNYVINKLKTDLSIGIESSVDNTGSSQLGGNWILESNNSNMINKYFNSNIYNYQFVLGSSSVTNTTPILLNNGTALIQNGSESIYFKDENGNNLTNIISVAGGGPAIPTGVEGSGEITTFGESWSFVNNAGLPLYYQYQYCEWYGVAISSNGKYISLVGSNNINATYVSSDYGKSWASKPFNNLNDIDMSSDGQYQTAVKAGNVHRSVDYGNTWTALGLDATWKAISISSSGQYQTIVGNGTQIWYSSNYGQTWSQTESGRNWTCVKVSSTGQYQIATVWGGRVYQSSNYGVSWTQNAYFTTNQNFLKAAISSNGQYILVGTTGGIVYRSTNGGINWIELPAIDGVNGINACTMSPDGKYQAYSIGSGIYARIYVSSDYGTTFTRPKSNFGNGVGYQSFKWFNSGIAAAGFTGGQLTLSISSNKTLAGTYYALTSNGYVYAMGSNSCKGNSQDVNSTNGCYAVGLLGQGSDDPSYYSSNGVKVKLDSTTPVTNAIQVEATGDSYAILLSNNKVLVGGSNANGRTGQGISNGYLTFASYVKNSTNTGQMIDVKKIALGSDWMLMLKIDKYVWGCGNDVSKISAASGDKLLPTIVRKTDNNYINNVLDIACGDNHQLILSGGTVFAGGSNAYGQLGNGTTTNSLLTRMKINSTTNLGTNVIGIAAGLQSSAVLLKSMPSNSNASPAGIYSCGRNLKGELGIGNTTQQTFLTKMKSNASTDLAVDNVKMIEQYPNRTGILYNDGTIKMVGDFAGIPGYLSNQTYPVDYTVSGTPITNASSISSRSVLPISLTELTTSGYTTADLKLMGYTATQLKAAFHTLTQLSGAGFTAGELKEATFSVTELRDVKNGSNVNYFTPQQVIQAGFDASTLKNLGGYSALELKQYGSFTLSQLADISYSANQLKNANYSVTELRDVKNGSNVNYFTPQQVIQAGFDASTLKNDGEYSALQLKQYGSFTLSQLVDATYTINQLKDANYSVTELRDVKNGSNVNYFTPQQVIQVGFDISTLKNLGGYSALELKQYGSFTLSQLADISYSASELKNANYSVTELKNIKNGSNVNYFTTQQVIQAGFDASTLKNDGEYSASQLKELGSYNLIDLIGAGYSTSNLKDAQYSVSDLKNAKDTNNNYLLTPQQVIQAGFDILTLKNQGNYSAAQIKQFGSFTFNDFVLANYNATDLRNADYSITDLKQANFKYDHILKAGYSVTDLNSENYTLVQMKNANYTFRQLSESTLYSVPQLKNVGFKAIDLKNSSYQVDEIINKGYTMKNVKAAQFTVQELRAKNINPLTLLGTYTLREIKQGGYTIQEMNSAILDSVQFTGIQLKNAGYSAGELKSVGYNLNQLVSLKYTPKNLKDADYNASDLSSVGISNRVLRHIGLM